MRCDSNSHPFQEWLGRVRRAHDTATAAPLRLLSAMLDRHEQTPVLGSPLPPLWHWLYFLPGDRQSTLGGDGHAARGDFLPPVPLRSRMWAGSQLTFLRPLAVGHAVSRTSRIEDIRVKSGRSGELVFVRVHHEIGDEGGAAVIEYQDIVYRDTPPGGARAPCPAPPAEEQFSRIIRPDPVLLFRYSALTFNSHRIHYDRPYAIEEEGYPGLVVHGPLVALLLLELLRQQRADACIGAYQFRATGPLFDTAAFTVCGRIDTGVATLWARDTDGGVAMTATALFA